MLLSMEGVGRAVELEVNPAVPSSRATVSATRGGAQLAAATVVSLVANYVFLLGAGRLLGSRDYSTLAALTGVLTVVLLPSGALQMAVSREVSRHEALGEEREAAAFVRALMLLGLKVTVPLVAVAFALIVPLRHVLNIDSSGAVGLAFVSLAFALVTPIAFGVLQGYQRFRTLAWASAAPMIVRLGVLLTLAVVGFRLYGAIVALAASAVAGGAIGLVAIRDRRPATLRLPAPSLRPFLRYLGPVAVGLFAISLLTNADILIVKARFPAHDAGVYAAASAFARVAFFLPATILAVLFPRTAARVARGESADDILGRSLIVTVGFCGLLTAGYALVGGPLVRTTFGAQFAPAGDLLVLFSVVMGLFSLVNVFVGYHLSRGDNRYAWIVAAGVAAQLALLATVPGSLRGVLWIDVAVGAVLLMAHELVMGSSVTALGSGLRRFDLGAMVRRALAAVSRARYGLLEAGIVAAGYALVTVALTWPLAFHMGTRVPGTLPNDGLGGAAWFWQLHQEGGYHLLGVSHHTLTGAPLGWDQGNALNFQWLLPDYPGYIVGGWFSGVAALNFVTLSGFALSGAAMYLLVRRLGCGRLVSSWAGVVYIAFPWHFERALAGHVTLVHLEVFPLFLLAAIAWVRRPTEGRALLVWLVVVSAWLTSGYFGTMLLLALVGVSAVGLWVHRRSSGTVPAVRKATILWGGALVASGAFAAVALLAGGSTGISIGRAAGNIGFYGAHLRSYLPDPLNGVAGPIAQRLDGRLVKDFGAETRLFPGVLTILLALVWVVAVRRRRASARAPFVTGTLVAVVLVAVAFAAPDPTSVFGLHVHPMPSFLTLKLVPAFRVPSRLAALLLTALVPLAALGLSWLVTSGTRRFGPYGGRAASLAVVGAATAFSVVELAILPFPTTGVGGVAPVYAEVGRTPVGVLAEYPLENPGYTMNSAYLFGQLTHHRPLLNGAAVGTPPDALRRMLVDPSAPGTAPGLAFLGVTAIVTRPTTFQWQEIPVSTPDRASYGPGYALAASVGNGVRVWRLSAQAAPAVAAYAAADVAEPLAPTRDGFVGYVLNGRLAHLEIYAKNASSAVLHVAVQTSSGRAALRISGQDGARVFAFRGRRSLEVPLSVPRGRSVLTLSVLPPGTNGATADWTHVSLSTAWFVAGRPHDGNVAFRPTVVSRDPGLR